MTDGAMTISPSGLITGGNAADNTGEIATGQSYASDQYSQIVTTSTQLSGGQWIGVAVRAQAGGQNLYLGLYWWQNGSPVLMLFKRTNGNFAELGSYSSGPLPAGTQLQLTAMRSTIVFSANGIDRISATDTDLTGGSPGVMAYGTATAQSWTGGNAGFRITYQSTDASGIKYYDILSNNDGYGVQTLRVLQPTHPAAGVAHNFLFVLPVEAGLGNQHGDGLATMQALDAEDQYNLTIVEPTFFNLPWYADNPNDPNLQYETFMTNELVPWVEANLSTTGTEQNWLIGFSKSGVGGQDLLLKHPNLFAAAASWDFPADISSYDEYAPDSTANYGTEANFAANYQLTPAFLSAHAAPFKAQNRIWIGGYSVFQTDISDYDTLLTSQGIAHTDGPSQNQPHAWESSWVSPALAALYQDSLTLPPGP